MSGTITRTGGREATEGLIEGEVALAVGMPTAAVPTGWRWRKLTDLSRLETGHTPSRSKPEYWDGDIPWIGIRDATGNHGRTLPDTMQHVTQAGIDNSSARVLPTNTVCLSRTASVGYVVVMGREMATSQDFVNWVCDERKLDYRYLKYVLLAEQRSFSRFSHGTTHQTIYFPEVKAFHICAPEIDGQRAIADVLSSLDDKIEQNRRTGRQLEALARAVFKAWFVDFEPVKAKAAGATAFPGLPTETFASLPKTLQDSPLGPVPEGWEVGTMGDIGTQRREQIAPEATDGETPYIGLEHMPRRDITLSDWDTAASVTSSKFRFCRGDILFGKLRPYFHKVGPAPIDGVCSTDIVVLHPKKPGYTVWLLMLVSSDEFVAHSDRSSAGTKMPRTNWKDMAAYGAAVPPLPVASAFQGQIEPMLHLITGSIHESRRLATLRDYLLPRLLSGRVRVGDTELSSRLGVPAAKSSYTIAL